MKSSKADGAKYSKMNGAATPGETGPLFPRLHVSRTEKAGPRAPPRNKMALFEQFTVPSHRLGQPSRPSTPTLNQKQQFVPNDCRYPYVSYYAPSSVPYSNINHGIVSDSKPSHGVSSCMTSSGSALVTDQESQRALRLQTGEKSVEVSRAATKEDGSIILSSLLERKAKVASDDNVPKQSWPRAQAKDVQGMFRARSGGSENRCNKFSSVESAERPIITNSINDLQEAVSTVEEVLACPMVEIESCAEEGEEVNVHLRTALGQFCQQLVGIGAVIEPDKVLSEDMLLHVYDRVGGKNNGAQASAEKSMAREEQSPSRSGIFLVDNAQTTFTSECFPAFPNACKDTQKGCCPSDGEKGDACAGSHSADSLRKGKGESIGESHNNQIGSNEGSELSQHGTGLSGHSDDSPLSVLAEQAFRPKDVIRAVGQQQFWKARKALLRQQRIFSDQVFQLHKLIKVQKLLAETPCTLIDEEMPFGAMDKCAVPASPCTITEREHCLIEKVRVADPCLEERKEHQANNTRTQPKITQKPESFAPVGNDDMGSNPYLPPFSLGGTSAWGYPSVGMGQWMGPMAAQNRPSAYQPFAGTFPPGAPFGGMYGSAMLGPSGTQLFPFGIPYSGQRSEPWEEMSSNHGPAAGSNHQAATDVGYSPSQMANNLSGAWHFLPFSHPYYNQRLSASVSEKDISTGSGASINNQKPTEAVHPSGMCYPWGDASQAGQLNTNAFENSGHQRENSPPRIATGSKFKSSACMPPAPVSRKAGSHHQEAENPAQSAKMNKVFQNRSFKKYEANRAGGREEENTTAPRWPKHQQGGQVPFDKGHMEETLVDCSPDHSGNALDLFPLVPSLSPDGQGDPKQAREHWQGQVIKVVPRPAVAASKSAAGILLSLQRERRQ
eukprot:c11633_g1_i1 orf=142-2823(+)